MKLFKKKGKQGKQQIKAGDYVVIRNKHWDDETKWVAQTGYIFKVLSVKDGKVAYRYECSDEDSTADICNCVKIPKEEVAKYWEDMEKPNIYYFIDIHGEVKQMEGLCFDWQNKMVEIGNYFESREEAEKAVEKLKALANLRKRGLKFNGWDSADRGLVGEFEIYCDAVNLDGIEQELELVFGREEI